MEYSSVSDRLRQIRERSGLSIRALADKVGVPTSTYSNYESRYKRPYLPMEFTKALANALTGTGITQAEVMALAGIGHPPAVFALTQADKSRTAATSNRTINGPPAVRLADDAFLVCSHFEFDM